MRGDRFVRCPRGAKDLEGGKSEARGLVFEQNRTEFESLGKGWEWDEGRGVVVWEALVERENLGVW